MNATFVHLETGQPFGRIPDAITLDETRREVVAGNPRFITREVEYREGDPNFLNALASWMYRRGYVKES